MTKTTSLSLPLLLSGLLGVVTTASAVVIPGGGSGPDCAVGFEVEQMGSSVEPTASAANRADGKACNKTCTFTVSLCINEPVAGCTASPVTALKVKPALLSAPPLGGADHVCGTPLSVTLKQGKKKIFKVTATTAAGKDKDKLVLRCLRNANNADCGGTPPDCAPNPAGGPSEVIFTTLGDGTDLDNGWTGTSHNFPVVKDAAVKACLTGCDASSNPVCTMNGPTGLNTINGQTFGPPLPLIAGGVSVCVVNTFNGPTSGTIHVDTGVVDMNAINLNSEVFVTTADHVCPRCETGTCDAGPNRGKQCTPTGSVTVVNAQTANKNFMLSPQCPPGATGTGAATLSIPLRPVTGMSTTPGTGGSKPCQENLVNGVPVHDNGCGAAGCGALCTGQACVKMIVDPTDPAGQRMVCEDVKGGISQVCCNGSPTTPCFPTEPGNVGIVRTGRAVVPMDANGQAWPAGTYPKTAMNEVTASTFCIAATGASNVDSVTGLPGPGAVIFNTLMTVK